MPYNTSHRGGWNKLGLVFTLYRIDCRINGKSYIGVTGHTVAWRWKQHLKKAQRKEAEIGILYRAIRKYGVEAFSIEAIETTADAVTAQKRERELILSHKTLAPAGMNATTGGELLVGIVRSEETLAKLAKARAGRVISAETRAKISAANKGLVRSPEAKAKISAANKGRKPAPQTIAAIVEANKGKRRSPESIAKFVQTRTGVKATPEALANMIAAGALRRGISMTAEVKAKIAATKRANPKRWTLSPETRARQSAAQKVAKNSEDAHAKQREAWRKRREKALHQHIKDPS